MEFESTIPGGFYFMKKLSFLLIIGAALGGCASRKKDAAKTVNQWTTPPATATTGAHTTATT